MPDPLVFEDILRDCGVSPKDAPKKAIGGLLTSEPFIRLLRAEMRGFGALHRDSPDKIATVREKLSKSISFLDRIAKLTQTKIEHTESERAARSYLHSKRSETLRSSMQRQRMALGQLQDKVMDTLSKAEDLVEFSFESCQEEREEWEHRSASYFQPKRSEILRKNVLKQHVALKHFQVRMMNALSRAGHLIESSVTSCQKEREEREEWQRCSTLYFRSRRSEALRNGMQKRNRELECSQSHLMNALSKTEHLIEYSVLSHRKEREEREEWQRRSISYLQQRRPEALRSGMQRQRVELERAQFKIMSALSKAERSIEFSIKSCQEERKEWKRYSASLRQSLDNIRSAFAHALLLVKGLQSERSQSALNVQDLREKLKIATDTVQVLAVTQKRSVARTSENLSKCRSGLRECKGRIENSFEISLGHISQGIRSAQFLIRRRILQGPVFRSERRNLSERIASVEAGLSASIVVNQKRLEDDALTIKKLQDSILQASAITNDLMHLMGGLKGGVFKTNYNFENLQRLLRSRRQLSTDMLRRMHKQGEETILERMATMGRFQAHLTKASSANKRQLDLIHQNWGQSLTITALTRSKFMSLIQRRSLWSSMNTKSEIQSVSQDRSRALGLLSRLRAALNSLAKMQMSSASKALSSVPRRSALMGTFHDCFSSARLANEKKDYHSRNLLKVTLASSFHKLNSLKSLMSHYPHTFQSIIHAINRMLAVCTESVAPQRSEVCHMRNALKRFKLLQDNSHSLLISMLRTLADKVTQPRVESLPQRIQMELALLSNQFSSTGESLKSALLSRPIVISHLKLLERVHILSLRARKQLSVIRSLMLARPMSLLACQKCSCKDGRLELTSQVKMLYFKSIYRSNEILKKNFEKLCDAKSQASNVVTKLRSSNRGFKSVLLHDYFNMCGIVVGLKGRLDNFKSLLIHIESLSSLKPSTASIQEGPILEQSQAGIARIKKSLENLKLLIRPSCCIVYSRSREKYRSWAEYSKRSAATHQKLSSIINESLRREKIMADNYESLLQIQSSDQSIISGYQLKLLEAYSLLKLKLQNEKKDKKRHAGSVESLYLELEALKSFRGVSGVALDQQSISADTNGPRVSNRHAGKPRKHRGRSPCYVS